MLPYLSKSHQKVLPDWAKSRQNGKNLPKWLKVLKLGSKGFQAVPDGSRSQTAWARMTRGTYAQAPCAFAALGQGLKGPDLVISNFNFLKNVKAVKRQVCFRKFSFKMI